MKKILKFIFHRERQPSVYYCKLLTSLPWKRIVLISILLAIPFFRCDCWFIQFLLGIDPSTYTKVHLQIDNQTGCPPRFGIIYDEFGYAAKTEVPHGSEGELSQDDFIDKGSLVTYLTTHEIIIRPELPLDTSWYFYICGVHNLWDVGGCTSRNTDPAVYDEAKSAVAAGWLKDTYDDQIYQDSGVYWKQVIDICTAHEIGHCFCIEDHPYGSGYKYICIMYYDIGETIGDIMNGVVGATLPTRFCRLCLNKLSIQRP